MANAREVSWAFGAGHEDKMTEIFLTALGVVIGDAESAAAEARSYGTVQRWREGLQARTGGGALGASLIPGLHGGGLIVELPYLLRLMGRGAIGTGELIGATIEPDIDLLAIFAVWSGAISKSALASAVGGVVIIEGVAYPAFGAKALAIGLQIGVKSAGVHAGVSAAAGAASHMLQPVFRKVLAKIGAKVSAKIGAKAYAKFVTGFIPLLGACASAGISLYILNEFLTSAKIYYEHKNRDSGLC